VLEFRFGKSSQPRLKLPEMDAVLDITHQHVQQRDRLGQAEKPMHVLPDALKKVLQHSAHGLETSQA